MENGSGVTTAENLMTLVLERVRATANVEMVYGVPQTVGEKTIVPIAALAYGFGVGAGMGRALSLGCEPSGTGGGGGVRVQPIAVLEVTEAGSRVIPVIDWTSIIKAAVAVLIPLLLARSARRVIGR